MAEPYFDFSNLERELGSVDRTTAELREMIDEFRSKISRDLDREDVRLLYELEKAVNQQDLEATRVRTLVDAGKVMRDIGISPADVARFFEHPTIAMGDWVDELNGLARITDDPAMMGRIAALGQKMREKGKWPSA
jgi:hypothetical protein